MSTAENNLTPECAATPEADTSSVPAKLWDEIRRLEQVIQEKQDAIEQQQAWIQQLDAFIARKESHIQELTRQLQRIDEQQAWIQELEASLAAKDEHIAMLEERNAKSEEARTKAAEELSALRQRIMNIESSTFWQRTASLHKDL